METITLAMWVKLKREEENLSLFNIDPTSDGRGAVVALEVVHGKIRWSHQDNNGLEIFELITGQRGVMPQGLWTHVAASYDSHKGREHLIIIHDNIISSRRRSPMKTLILARNCS